MKVVGSVGALGFSVGADHACAVFSDATLHCWGRNEHAQLGDGTTFNPAVGTLVTVAGY